MVISAAKTISQQRRHHVTKSVQRLLLQYARSITRLGSTPRKGKKKGEGQQLARQAGKKKNASSFPYKVDEGTSDGRYELLNLITLSLLCFYKKQKLLLEETVNKTEAMKSETTD